MVNAVRPQMTI